MDNTGNALLAYDSDNNLVASLHSDAGGSGVPALILGGDTGPVYSGLVVQNDVVGGSPTSNTTIIPYMVSVSVPSGETTLVAIQLTTGTTEVFKVHASGNMELTGKVTAASYKVGSNQVVGARGGGRPRR